MSHPPHTRTALPLDAGSGAPDAELVGRARGGDADAFGVLVRRYLPAAHAVACAVVGERADAEDVCQDAFLRAYERLDDCRPAEHFRRWLLASVRNRAISHRRWRRVRLATVLGTARGEIDVPAPAVGPHADAEHAELRARLAAALETLPEAHRTVVVLHDVEGWRHREIAELLGVAHGTSRAILFAARRRLRAQLAPLSQAAHADLQPGRAPAHTVRSPFALEYVA